MSMTEDMRVDKATKILTLDKAKKDETESGNQTLTTCNIDENNKKQMYKKVKRNERPGLHQKLGA